MEEEARELEAKKRAEKEKADEEARLEAEKKRLEEIVRQQEAEKEERRRLAAELKRKAEALEAEEREREEERKKKQRTQECLHIFVFQSLDVPNYNLVPINFGPRTEQNKIRPTFNRVTSSDRFFGPVRSSIVHGL